MAPLERDSGTATVRYAMHISWLPAKPCVILRPRGPVRSYVQLNEAFSPAGTRTGASSHFQLFVTFPWRQTDTSPAVRQFKSPLEWVWRRSPRTRTCVEERLRTLTSSPRTPKLFPALTSTSRLNLKHLCARIDLKVDDEDDRVKLNRQMGFCCGEPVCGALYYANGVGEYDNSDERRGQDWSEKTTGSSIELSFCDSRAKETSPKAEDRATATPTAEEVLFRLEHFLVFE